MAKLTLNYIGTDSWSRDVFESKEGKLFKDVSCGMGSRALCTVCGGFDGEPDTPLHYIKKYEGMEIEIIGLEDMKC